MNLRTIKTDVIHTGEISTDSFIEKFVPQLAERDIIVVSAKILSLCADAVVREGDKNELAVANAQYYINADESKYGQMLTIASDTLLVAAGIDESNADEGYILLPDNLDKLALKIRLQLMRRDRLKEVGVLLVDSASRPLRVGTVGTCLASAGVSAVKDYRNKEDVFGRKIAYSQANHVEAIAAISVAAMGEGDEQTPIVRMSDVSFVEFIDGSGGVGSIDMQDDLFAPVLTAAEWQKGGTDLLTDRRSNVRA